MFINHNNSNNSNRKPRLCITRSGTINKKEVEKNMIAKPIPEDMKDYMNNESIRETISSYTTMKRCMLAYKKINFSGWPTERTCALFDISTTWYRNRVMRYGAEWDAEFVRVLNADRLYKEFIIRAGDIMHVDFENELNDLGLYDVIADGKYGREFESAGCNYDLIPEQYLKDIKSDVIDKIEEMKQERCA